jgi:hypothetical protein
MESVGRSLNGFIALAFASAALFAAFGLTTALLSLK